MKKKSSVMLQKYSLLATVLMWAETGWALLDTAKITAAKAQSKSEGFQKLCEAAEQLLQAHKDFGPTTPDMQGVKVAWEAAEAKSDAKEACKAAHIALDTNTVPMVGDPAYSDLLEKHQKLHEMLSGSKGVGPSLATSEEAAVMRNIAYWDAVYQCLGSKPVGSHTYPYVFPMHTNEIDRIYHKVLNYYEEAAGQALTMIATHGSLPTISTTPAAATPQPQTPPQSPTTASVAATFPSSTTHKNPYKELLSHITVTGKLDGWKDPAFCLAAEINLWQQDNITDDEEKTLKIFFEKNWNTLKLGAPLPRRGTFETALKAIPTPSP